MMQLADRNLYVAVERASPAWPARRIVCGVLEGHRVIVTTATPRPDDSFWAAPHELENVILNLLGEPLYLIFFRRLRIDENAPQTLPINVKDRRPSNGHFYPALHAELRLQAGTLKIGRNWSKGVQQSRIYVLHELHYKH